MSDLTTLHVFVSGRVQGVWFRAFTREQALAENITGWAKNLPDGRVEVMLSGSKDCIEKVAAALQQGPELSSVAKLERQAVDYQAFEGFHIS